MCVCVVCVCVYVCVCVCVWCVCVCVVCVWCVWCVCVCVCVVLQLGNSYCTTVTHVGVYDGGKITYPLRCRRCQFCTTYIQKKEHKTKIQCQCSPNTAAVQMSDLVQ